METPEKDLEESNRNEHLGKSWQDLPDLPPVDPKLWRHRMSVLDLLEHFLTGRPSFGKWCPLFGPKKLMIIRRCLLEGPYCACDQNRLGVEEKERSFLGGLWYEDDFHVNATARVFRSISLRPRPSFEYRVACPKFPEKPVT